MSFVGAAIGNWLARTLGLPQPLLAVIQGEQSANICSVIRQAMLVAIVGIPIGRRR